MSRILRHRAIVEDDWTLAVDTTAPPSAADRWIVPLARWLAARDTLGAGALGVLLPNTEDVETLYPQIAASPVIALQFPTFADGHTPIWVRRRAGAADATGSSAR